MGKYQVFKKATIEGTEVECYVSSFTEEERRVLDPLSGDPDATATAVMALTSRHIHDMDDVRSLLFETPELMLSELSTGQITALGEQVMVASGSKSAARFPDGEGEAGGAESPQPE